MDKFNFYNGLRVSQDHLREQNDNTAEAIGSHIKVSKLYGINGGISVSGSSLDPQLGQVADLDVVAGSFAFDQYGNRIRPAQSKFQVFIDQDGNPISYPPMGYNKICRVYLKYAEVGADPVIPPAEITEIDSRLLDGFEVVVRDGPDFLIADDPVYPTAGDGEIVIADIRIPGNFNSGNVIVTGYVSQDKADWMFVTSDGTPVTSLKELIIEQNTETLAEAAGFDFDLITPNQLSLKEYLQGAVAEETLEEALAQLLIKIQMTDGDFGPGANYVGTFLQQQWINGDYVAVANNTGSDPGPAAMQMSIRDSVARIISGLGTAGSIGHCGISRIATHTNTAGQKWVNNNTFYGPGRTTLEALINGIISDLGASAGSGDHGSDRVGHQTTGTIAWANGTNALSVTRQTVSRFVHGMVADLARNDSGTSDSGASRIGLFGDSGIGLVHGTIDDSDVDTVQKLLTALKAIFANSTPKSMQSTLGGLLTLVSAATRLNTSYINDTETLTSNVATTAPTAVDMDQKLLFTFGGDAHKPKIRVYYNAFCLMVTYNCRWYASAPDGAIITYYNSSDVLSNYTVSGGERRNFWIVDTEYGTAGDSSFAVCFGRQNHLFAVSDVDIDPVVGAAPGAFTDFVLPLHILQRRNVGLPTWTHTVSEGTTVPEHSVWRMFGFGEEPDKSGATLTSRLYAATNTTYDVS